MGFQIKVEKKSKWPKINLSVTGFTFIHTTRRERLLTPTRIFKSLHFCDGFHSVPKHQKFTWAEFKQIPKWFHSDQPHHWKTSQLLFTYLVFHFCEQWFPKPLGKNKKTLKLSGKKFKRSLFKSDVYFYKGKALYFKWVTAKIWRNSSSYFQTSSDVWKYGFQIKELPTLIHYIFF